jgi:hypothetical protein
MSFPRRYLRFRLRTLLVLVFVISVGLGGFAWRRDRARRQAAAVATIRQLGATVVYEPNAEEDLHIFLLHMEPTLPGWQERWFGADFFYDIVEVSQGTWSRYHFGKEYAETAEHFEPAEADAFWKAVARFRGLRSLYVYRELAPPRHVRGRSG